MVKTVQPTLHHHLIAKTVQEAIRLEGRRFSPLLTARLRERQTAELIRSALDQSRRETAAEMFEAGA